MAKDYKVIVDAYDNFNKKLYRDVSYHDSAIDASVILSSKVVDYANRFDTDIVDAQIRMVSFELDRIDRVRVYDYNNN